MILFTKKKKIAFYFTYIQNIIYIFTYTTNNFDLSFKTYLSISYTILLLLAIVILIKHKNQFLFIYFSLYIFFTIFTYNIGIYSKYISIIKSKISQKQKQILNEQKLMKYLCTWYIFTKWVMLIWKLQKLLYKFKAIQYTMHLIHLSFLIQQ